MYVFVEELAQELYIEKGTKSNFSSVCKNRANEVESEREKKEEERKQTEMERNVKRLCWRWRCWSFLTRCEQWIQLSLEPNVLLFDNASERKDSTWVCMIADKYAQEEEKKLNNDGKHMLQKL